MTSLLGPVVTPREPATTTVTAEDFDVVSLRNRRADNRWDRTAVGDVLERVIWSLPNKTALVGWEGAYADPRFARMTYREADEAANQVANALVAEGLAPGDRVLLYCDNSVEAIILMFGIAKAGMVAVPVNSMLAPDVLAHVLETVDVSLVVADRELIDRGLDVFQRLAAPLRVAIEIGGTAPDGTVGFSGWLDEQPRTEVDVRIHGDDIWELLFTSGTTSMPKASMTSHSYSYLCAHSYALSLTRGLAQESDVVIGTFLPIVYHCGHNATVIPALVCGGTAVIGRRPDARALAEAVTHEGVTAVWAGSPEWVENLVARAEEDPEAIDLSSLSVVMYSWGAMSPDLLPRLREQAGEEVGLLELFGQTESMAGFRFWPAAHPERAADSHKGVNHVGVASPIVAADLRDPAGRSVWGRAGEPGEAVYRSPVLTAGYYRNPEATAEAFRDGWFHSGDVCSYVAPDERAAVMLDRIKDIVKSGGENVSSMRVETVLSMHPDVARVAVVGEPDEKWGEKVTAVVIPAPGASPTESGLISWARTRLAGFETPKRVVFVDSFPVTVGGKVRKHDLRVLLQDA